MPAGVTSSRAGSTSTRTSTRRASTRVTADDFETGTRAAACGGTTTIVDFCQQAHGQSLADALRVWHEKADGKASIDYGFHIIVRDMNDAVEAELGRLPDEGVTSFKLFMAYKGMLGVDDLTLVRALEQARRAGALVMVHAENGDAAYFLQQKYVAAGKTAPKYHADTRPPRVEAEATARAIALAEIVGTSIYIVHLTCRESLEEVVRGTDARSRRPGRDLHSLPLRDQGRSRSRRLRGRQVRVHATRQVARRS